MAENAPSPTPPPHSSDFPPPQMAWVPVQPPAQPVTPSPDDPLLSHVMRPSLTTGETQFAGAVTFLSALYVLAVGEHWLYADQPTQTFVMTWLPILVPVVLGGLLILGRTALKILVGRRYLAAGPAPAPPPG